MNRGVCLLVVERKGEWAGRGGRILGCLVQRVRDGVAGSRLWGWGGHMSGGWRGGSERRGYYLRRRGRLVLGGTINEGVCGGWGAVCLHW